MAAQFHPRIEVFGGLLVRLGIRFLLRSGGRRGRLLLIRGRSSGFGAGHGALTGGGGFLTRASFFVELGAKLAVRS